MVDWARAAGLEVVAAGKGTKYLPAYHQSTPETVWRRYGFTPEQVAAGDFNAQMFNSFLDGTKSAIEMAAVANATGLTPAPEGLSFPPCGVDDLPRVLRPRSDGGSLHHKGQVEVVSSLERDGRPVFRDLRWGVYVTFEAGTPYVERCFREYGLVTDESGRYAAMYKPFHLIGLELGISVASVGLRREPTGSPRAWVADAVATAKRDLAAGEVLDGEGGYRVYGRLMPAAGSRDLGGLPIGLAHGVRLRQPVAQGRPVRWADVEFDPGAEAVRVRREMESAGPGPAASRWKKNGRDPDEPPLAADRRHRRRSDGPARTVDRPAFASDQPAIAPPAPAGLSEHGASPVGKTWIRPARQSQEPRPVLPRA